MNTKTEALASFLTKEGCQLVGSRYLGIANDDSDHDFLCSETMLKDNQNIATLLSLAHDVRDFLRSEYENIKLPGKLYTWKFDHSQYSNSDWVQCLVLSDEEFHNQMERNKVVKEFLQELDTEIIKLISDNKRLTTHGSGSIFFNLLYDFIINRSRLKDPAMYRKWYGIHLEARTFTRFISLKDKQNDVERSKMVSNNIAHWTIIFDTLVNLDLPNSE